MKTIYTCFCTDVIHEGHLHIIEEAHKYGAVIVGALSDRALIRCMRFPTIPFEERVRLYDDDQAFMRDLFRIQEVLDWPTGQQMRPNWVKYVLLDGKDILEMETDFSYRKLEYEENKEYYNDMKQDVAAALLGTFGMSEEELSELMGMERDSEKVDELVRRIFEREGWEYEED